MVLKLSGKDLEKLGNIEGLNEKKKKRTSFCRLKDAIETMNKSSEKDRVYFNTDYTVCILEFQDIAFLSYNDLLRLHNKDLYKFKMGWHDRIAKLLHDLNLEKWESMKKEPILVEFLYRTKNAQIYDPDAIVSAFKSALDGLVHAGLLEDDKVENVPLIIPKQEKTKGTNSLYIVLSKMPNIEEFYSDTFKMVINNKNNT